jgi:D-glycero-alpha-D-manno-heptose-7-phosphate kinase
MAVIRAKAPLRLSFAGGGTDISPFPENEGGLVLSCGISLYACGSLRSRRDDQVTIESADLGTCLKFSIHDEPGFDGDMDLVKAALRRISVNDGKGYHLVLRSDAPPGTGLGASSALMVVIIALLREHYQLEFSDYDLAQLAYSIERKDLGIDGGLQDQFSATYGGLNLLEFTDRVAVRRLEVPGRVLSELELNLLLCYTGLTRRSDEIIKDQLWRLHRRDAEATEALRAQKHLARAMGEALADGDLGLFGRLLGEAWTQKKRMSPRITTSAINEAYEIGLANGAIGGKVTGAGGGGYLLFFCDFEKKHHVARALKAGGFGVREFGFDSEGLRIWRGYH